MTIKSIATALAVAVPMLAVSAPAQAAGYYVDRWSYVVGVANWDVLNIRAWPASYSRKVGAISPHAGSIYVQRCKVAHNGSDWCKVRYHGTWGWVNSRFLAYH